MKPRRGRAWLRWTLLGLTLAALGLHGVSLMRTVGVGGSRGALAVSGQSIQVFAGSMEPSWIWEPATPVLAWWPRVLWTDPDWLLVVPLWIPTGLCGVAAGASWWRWWRRKQASACVRCGYDLRGLPSGVCPECGHCPAKS